MSVEPFRWADPKTWPWIVYVWLGFLLLGWLVPAWRWLQRRRASEWPTTDGKIESVEVNRPQFSLTTTRGAYVATLAYSYTVGGSVYSGKYKREFPNEMGAEDFVRDLQDKAVAVRYRPNTPSRSAVLEADIEAVLQNRPPRADSDSIIADAIPEWLRPLIWVFVLISAVGLVLSLWVHIGAIMGHPPSSIFWVLHAGIFLVWFPAVMVAQRLVGRGSRKDSWKVILKGTPDWMRYMVYGFFGYAFVNFLYFMQKAPGGSSGFDAPASMWRGFSGHWMAFYSAAMAILYSAAKKMESSPRCTNGHLATPNALYCSKCGQPILRAR